MLWRLCVGAILAYRLIPEGVRGRWSAGTSTSAHGLATFRGQRPGGMLALRMFRVYATPHMAKDVPGWHLWDPGI